MADYGGRKWTIILGCFIVVVAGLVQCFAVNIRMFTAARFLSKSSIEMHREQRLVSDI